MSLKNIVVEDCQFSIEVGGAVIGTGNVSVTSTASTNSKIKIGEVSKGIYTGPMAISVSGYTDGSISGGSGTGVINSSAQKVTVDTLPVILEGDSGDVVLTGTNPQSGAPVSGYTVKVKVISAGQMFVIGE